MLVMLALVPLLLMSCRPNHTPKPRAYFRIDLPERNYQTFDSIYPYGFEYPTYAEFLPDQRDNAEDFWADIFFPDFDGRIHLSYKPVTNENELAGYFEDARVFIHRHIPKASGIREELFVHENHNVYGMLFHIRGREAASPLQFYATDSLSHFLRGALYFNVAPNNDSLAPVILHLEEDIRHFMHTLVWQPEK